MIIYIYHIIFITVSYTHLDVYKRQTSLAVDEPLEYARLYLHGNLHMWVDTEDSLALYKARSEIVL